MIARIAQQSRSLWFWFLLFGLLAIAFFLTMAPAAGLAVPSRLLPFAQASLPQILSDEMFVRMTIGDANAGPVQLFYRRRDYQPVWLEDDNGTGRVLQAFARAAEEGLNPEDYAVPELPPRASAQARGRFELRLTASFLRYAADLRKGRVTPSQVYRDARLPRDEFDPAAALESALAQAGVGTLLSELAPPLPEYAALREGLQTYRAIASDGGWPSIPAGGASEIRAGDPRRDVLLSRLAYEDRTLAAASPEQTAIDLVPALQRYQRNNGLEADGRLGPKTLAMLNVTAAERVEQIIANMERWRWMPRNPEKRRILVNAADASLVLVERDEVLLASRVIVGAPHTPTPIFHAVATGVLVNPPWNVPNSIARNEILPQLKRDGAYLEKHDMILLDGPQGDPHGRSIDWRRIPAGSFPYRIRQRPGPRNPLGVAKLEMANSFDVYLHDTPGKAAYARNERNLSHGCIRVEEILPLASLALSGLGLFDAERLAAAIASGKTQTLPLPVPIAVYAAYWTAVPAADGSVHFRSDIYGRDRRLTAALRSRAAGETVAFYTGDCESSFG